MYNKIVLVGNLTRDVEITYSNNGSAIANTGIATSRKFKAQNGEQKEEVLFIDLTFFGRSAEIANQYLRKGSKILVDGRLQFQQWTDNQTGAKRSKHVLVVETMQMLDSRQQSESRTQPEYTRPQQRPQQQPVYNAPVNPQSHSSQHKQAVSAIDIDDDEIPF